MALSAVAKALALVLFLAAVAGATFGVGELLGSTVEQQLVTAEPVHLARNATAGHTVAYVVNVSNRDTVERSISVELSGAATGRSEAVSLLGNTTSALFVPVEVPATAEPGEHKLSLRVYSGGHLVRVRDEAVDLTILPEGPGLSIGDRADVVYSGRLALTGRTFATNDRMLVGVPFAKTDGYRYSEGLLPLSTAPRNVVEGIFEGVLGMQAGETRTLTFGFDKGYGPASEEDRIPRREMVDRTLVAENDAQRVPRATFDQYVRESGQGDPANFTVGSTFVLDQDDNRWPYRVTNMTAQVVEYKLNANVGDVFTLYPYWTNGTVVRSINETHVEFYTTPTTEPAPEGTCPTRGDATGSGCFTMRPEWPLMSTLDAPVNETTIVIRHDPPRGFTYTSSSQTGQPREATVSEVTQTEIVLALPSQHPLAGKDLTFDITVMSITKPAQPRTG